MATSPVSRKGKRMKLKVIVHEAEEGGYWAEVPALQGCVSQGETLEEVQANIREAIELYLEVRNESDGAQLPGKYDRGVQVLDIAV